MKIVGSFVHDQKMWLQQSGEFTVRNGMGLIHSGGGAHGQCSVTSSIAEINFNLS